MSYWKRARRALAVVVVLGSVVLPAKPAAAYTVGCSYPDAYGSGDVLFYTDIQPAWDFGTQGLWKLAVQNAVSNWNELVSPYVELAEWAPDARWDVNVVRLGFGGIGGSFSSPYRIDLFDNKCYRYGFGHLLGNKDIFEHYTFTNPYPGVVSTVLLHEFGHALSLNHRDPRPDCSVMGDVIDWYVNGGPCAHRAELPTDDDVNGVKAWYPIHPCVPDPNLGAVPAGYECA